MKKIFVFAIAAALILTAIIGGTVAQATDANIETQVHATEKVDIAFAGTKLDTAVKVMPGASAAKVVKIENKKASNPAWVWFTVTVPAAGENPLVTLTGTDAGWKLLSTKVENNLCTYTLGYETVLAADTTTTAGITDLEFAGQIDYFDGAYHWVVNGQAAPIQMAKNDFFVYFDAYAVDQTAGSTVEEACAAITQTP